MYSRDKSLVDNSSEETRSCVEFSVGVIVKMAILFKQIAKHTQKNILKKEKL